MVRRIGVIAGQRAERRSGFRRHTRLSPTRTAPHLPLEVSVPVPSAMEARILRTLLWFGLLESRTEGRSPTDMVYRRLYRKTPLFDRFVNFSVQVETAGIRDLRNWSV